MFPEISLRSIERVRGHSHNGTFALEELLDGRRAFRHPTSCGELRGCTAWLSTAPALRGPGDAREVPAHCLEGCLRASTWNLYATDEANSSGREECLAIGDTWV